MAEYIEREALRDALYDADAITMNGVKILNQFPSADVAQVRHGRWGSNGIPEERSDGMVTKHKKCYGKCDRCVWKNNGGCSEWRRNSA